MSTKTFCDRCERELGKTKLTWLRVDKEPTFMFEIHSWPKKVELCEKCFNDFKKWLKVLKQEKTS